MALPSKATFPLNLSSMSPKLNSEVEVIEFAERTAAYRVWRFSNNLYVISYLQDPGNVIYGGIGDYFCCGSTSMNYNGLTAKEVLNMTKIYENQSVLL